MIGDGWSSTDSRTPLVKGERNRETFKVMRKIEKGRVRRGRRVVYYFRGRETVGKKITGERQLNATETVTNEREEVL